jgi:NADPH:quinone reductase-like Zn-dependent oxidoreductase
VKVRAVALNPVDYKVAGRDLGEYPRILGLDVAGVVHQIGDGVVGLSIGDRVCYHGNLKKQGGGYAQYASIPAHVFAKIPHGVTFEDAASVLCAGMTAYQAINRKVTLKKGQTILIQGGAGGVGGYAIQIAALYGVTIFTTASAENSDYVKQLGAQISIDYQKENVKQRVLELTNGCGVDVVVDTISSQSATEGLGMLAFGGQLVCITGLPDFSVITPFTKAPSIHEIALGAAHSSGNKKAQEDLSHMASELLELVKQKKLSTMVTETISLEEVPRALEKLSKRHVKGKIIVNKF